ncbi:phage major capsid protein [Quadrisphaera setariae]|uniref:Phage major capsid protein n=1 Tax=Quadrisphaera setariae TaxID=2593304 RepID=A0A5C8ZHA4_9ACTN|nr:phage major capsid protein [Quadrisphaera setariae]TXR56473.1 phage major capsid protein [Quadrisphaera setariae]
MTATTKTFAALTQQQIYTLIVEPVQAQSVALQVCTRVPISKPSLRLPKIVDTGTAAWVEEGAAIPISDAAADEDEVTPKKVAGLRTITSELADDSDPAAVQQVGATIVTAIALEVDRAFFGPTQPSPAPAGLRSIGADANALVLPKTLVNVDPLLAAIAHGRDVGAPVTSFVTSPALALELATLKDASGSQRGLLQPDPTQPDRNVVGGVPILTSPFVEAGDVWAIPASRTFGVVRKDAKVEASTEFLWANDSVSVRGIMRVAFGMVSPSSISRIRRATS